MLKNKKLSKVTALALVTAFGLAIPSLADAGRTHSTASKIQHERQARPSRENHVPTERSRKERQPREVQHERERSEERESGAHREESRESFYEANRQENIKEINKENKVEDEYNKESVHRKDTDKVIFSRDDEEDTDNRKNDSDGDNTNNAGNDNHSDNSNNNDNADKENQPEKNDASDSGDRGKILGDVNSDGKVTQADAELLLEYIKEKLSCEDLDLSVADVNKDNTINIMDAVNILNYVKGKECSPGIGEEIAPNDFIVEEPVGHRFGVLYKPVIYLYTDRTTEVFVNIKLNGNLTCTYPKLNDGWVVSAKPDGTLTDKNGRNYSYLFWEGDTNVPMEFSKGFCVAGKDTEAFLVDKLSYMGLNDKEINDFVVFWLPRMQDNPYNVISFQTDNYLKAAQLEVSPQPDTMLRVFMAWKKSDSYVNIKAQKLEKTQRKGFSLVEWGGTEVVDSNKGHLIQ